jgi:hypothetical protein
MFINRMASSKYSYYRVEIILKDALSKYDHDNLLGNKVLGNFTYNANDYSIVIEKYIEEGDITALPEIVDMCTSYFENDYKSAIGSFKHHSLQ